MGGFKKKACVLFDFTYFLRPKISYKFVWPYGTYVFCMCILPYLCVMQYFHVIHVERYSKLAMCESQKNVACTILIPHLYVLSKYPL